MILWRKKRNTKKYIIIFAIILTFLIGAAFLGFHLKNNLIKNYLKEESVVIKDRNGEIINIKPNQKDFYAIYEEEIPSNLKELLLKKEDKYFYYHPGINPLSVARAFFYYAKGGESLTSSTITQQLAKIILGNENNRTIKNKLKEAAYALSLELFENKDEILKMYLNSVYFGDNMQGIKMAAAYYFNKSPEALTDAEIVLLLSSLNSPTKNNPFQIKNINQIKPISSQLNIDLNKENLIKEDEINEKKEKFSNFLSAESFFELNSLNLSCQKNCELTVDKNLTEKIREIVSRNINSLTDKGAQNAAVVVLKFPENELLAMVGSPDPKQNYNGYQINLAIRPRPIGSTIKPFIYAKGFEGGLRPFSLVEDKEYKYIIGSGFALYPKNYDYKYHGLVNLHYSLSNSLNVPTVKVLEFIGVGNFSNFLSDDLKFKSAQNLENYQLGIALGGLEMDLLTLSYYYTLFPNDGSLFPLRIYKNHNELNYNGMTDYEQNKNILKPAFAQLINKILSDRQTGVEQFGSNSVLNLPIKNYAVKTGTTKDFKDSWTIGYTPDFLVGVWVGNAENKPMDEISGQGGAGNIWNEVMSLLINSEYNKKTNFHFDQLADFLQDNKLEPGLKGDDYEKHLNLLMDNNLILSPHNNDTFLLEKNTKIPLEAREKVDWKINGKFLGNGKKIIFSPQKIGSYEIEANSNINEKINIFVEEEKN